MVEKDVKYSTNKDGKFITVPPIDEICDELKTKFSDMQERIEYLVSENKKLKDEAYSQNELAKMKERLDLMQRDYFRGFPITEKESAAIREWQTNHTEKIHNTKTPEQKLRLEGVSGGRWLYEFVPTAIGISGTCICSACKNKAIREAGSPLKFKTDYEYRNKIRELVKKYDAEFEFQELG